ncbi:DeoR/GlpR family DNA-binding transcription regulator [Acididesulfobacillus acetoxydans]|uniref:DeoR/GlpR family DNA-binding transcription regulator n=1 Tax=Acididesulfobacillus acetoxydans TaxID=1561005 RepID=UPI001F0CE926|nr:DeoR/GlpR family DNA-binding transcription regulator [Acididesulfobacillus acetoxydans]
MAEDRRKKIVEMLDEGGSVKVSRLAGTFQVTEETIRRDLELLEKDGYLTRTHGGAVKSSLDQQEIAFYIRNMRNREEKEAIGRKSLEYIQPGEVIALDASTTALQIARLLKENPIKDVVVITHALKVIMTLAESPTITVISTGGVLEQRTMSFVGSLAENALSNYNIKKAFVSCKGVTLEEGITESTDVQAKIKEEIVKGAKEVFLLADHDKFGQAALATVAPVTVVQKLITDDKTPLPEIERYRSEGIDVVAVDSGEGGR